METPRPAGGPRRPTVVVSIGSAWGDLRRRGRREHVWLVDERGALYGLNVATSEVDETVSGFEWPAGGFPDPSAELDPAQLVVWIANYQDSVTRVDWRGWVSP